MSTVLKYISVAYYKMNSRSYQLVSTKEDSSECCKLDDIIDNQSSKSEFQLVEQETFQLLYGAYLAMMSGILFSLASLFVYILNNVGIFQLTVYVMITQVLFSLPVALFLKQSIKDIANSGLVILYATMVALATIFSYAAIRNSSSLSDACTIIYAYPILSCILAKPFFKEKFDFGAISAIISVICGLCLLLKLTLVLPLFNHDESFGAQSFTRRDFLAFLAMILYAIAAIVGRKIPNKNYASLSVAIGCIGTVLGVAGVALFEGFKVYNISFLVILFLVLLGFCVTVGQMFACKLLQIDTTGDMNSVRSMCHVWWVLIWDMGFNHTVLSQFSVLGGYMVLFGNVTLSLRKWFNVI